MYKKCGFIGSAFGHGARIKGSEKSPEFLRFHDLHTQLGPNFQWLDIIKPRYIQEDNFCRNAVLAHNTLLAQYLSQLIQNPYILPIILGGDHSCAMGTWSGVTCAHTFGLIWIDAHMDAHTPQTSSSHYYHGMPLAHLLGYGDEQLRAILTDKQKIKPHNLVLIGARSYEVEEKEFLDRVGVKVFDTHAIQSCGIISIVENALKIATDHTDGFGISIDIDVFDPIEAPGTGARAINGVFFEQIRYGLQMLFAHPQFKCLELAEFNPLLDQDRKTEDLIKAILSLI